MNFAEIFFTSCPHVAEAVIKFSQNFNFFIAGICPFYQKLSFSRKSGVNDEISFFLKTANNVCERLFPGCWYEDMTENEGK